MLADLAADPDEGAAVVTPDTTPTWGGTRWNRQTPLPTHPRQTAEAGAGYLDGPHSGTEEDAGGRAAATGASPSLRAAR